MRLRTIQAPRMADAMARLRAELGEDAVILSTRRTGDGVEVTAAQEPDDEPLVIAPGDATPARAIPPALLRHNLPPALAARLGGVPLPAALAAAFRFEPLPAEARPLLLAGPPGAGKTLTAAKLATRFVLSGRAPLLVTADGRRAGATEQLAAFARVLGLPLAVAASPSALAKALARREAGQPAIVDLPGCDPFRPAETRALVAFRDAAGGAPVLVLPAGLDAEEAAETARAFHLLGCRHLLPTRLDAARRLGGVLAAADAGLAFTEAGIGPDAAGDLVAMDAAWLAERLREGRGQ
ncbi:GTP-binding protein [Falsiroseomonas sp. CW058]|uniref:flagellar biosynthesis protein FlhF n=1 Tax=Falsiroseomonas sp. CW058 TaxID=3388664 RepID=UPI003D31622E